MALKYARNRVLEFARPAGLIATVSLSLFAGGCAQVGVPELQGMLASDNGAAKEPVKVSGAQALQEATAYWGKKFNEHPRDLTNAINYSKNLKAMGRKKQALAVLQRAGIFHGNSRELASEYGRLALELGHVKVAEKVLTMADDPGDPDWKVISARGAVLAKQGQYDKAIPFFNRALTHANNQPSVMNNLALAHAMNGDAETAETILRQAIDKGGATKKMRQNLALVLSLQGKYSEATQISSRDVSGGQASSDTKVIRQMVRLDPKDSPLQNGNQFAGAFKSTTQDPLTSSQAWASQVAVSTSGQ